MIIDVGEISPLSTSGYEYPRIHLLACMSCSAKLSCVTSAFPQALIPTHRQLLVSASMGLRLAAQLAVNIW